MPARRTALLPALAFATWQALASTPAESAAGPQTLRILQHQALVNVSSDAEGRPRDIEAFGRRLTLQLERNDRMRVVTAERLPGVEAMRGSIAGIADSWVRLTRTPAGLYGMFFDGRDVYAVEPAHEARDGAVGALQADGNDPIVFRLADAVLPPGSTSCGVITLADVASGKPRTALQQFKAVAAELQALAADSPDKQIEIAIVGDFEFSGATLSGGLTPDQAVVARMNVVDGIFSSQVGVKLIVSSIDIFTDAADPFSSTATPSTLLDEFGNWRRATPAQSARGLSHLMTGRDLEGTTVGVAYVGALCSSRFGAGLSQGILLSSTTAALVIAHEIGHNFGATHDGESGAVCETTPQTFLMAPRINGSDQLSECSLTAIASEVATSACVVPLDVPDADLDLPAPARRLRGQAFDYAFTARSVGTRTVDAVTVNVTVPAALTLNSATIAGGAACTQGGSTATCSLGSLATLATRGITLNLTAQQSGTATANFSIGASNDAVITNNSGSAVFGIDPSADLAVTLSAAPANFAPGASSQITATVRHLSGDAVSDARLAWTVPAGLTVSAVAANALGCAVQSGTVQCTPSSIAVGSTEAVTLTVTSDQVGTRQVSANVSAALGDPVGSNNTAQSQLDVQAVVTVSASSGGGGGGSLGALEISALALLWLAHSLRALRRPRLRTSLRSPDASPRSPLQ